MAIKTSPYIPSFLKSALTNARPIKLTFSEISDTNARSTSSFLYDPVFSPLKNTQQLNVDWSQFENHTFFSSAEAKVNLAFDQIINGYPFDGTKAEVEAFFEKITGFDKYVFDQFPKYKGALLFSGTQVGEDTDGTLGTWIKTQDAAGALYPDISKNKTGESILNPKNGVSLSIEAQILVPAITNNIQTIFQKLSGSTEGYCLYLETNATTSSVNAVFGVMSASSYMTVSAPLQKGQYNHLCVSLNRDHGVHYLQFYVDSELVSTSTNKFVLGDMNIDTSDFLIGSGTKATFGSTIVTPTQTFSGCIDEFRVFHSTRKPLQQQLYAQKSIFQTPDLKLYYKFNEPGVLLGSSESDAINSIVLDSSGNALHALINEYTSSLRLNASTDTLNPMTHEKLEVSPVLFPAHEDIVDLNVDLLFSASLYDKANPNIITKLIPQHYLQEGAQLDGFENLEGLAGNQYSGTGIPGQGEMGNVQIILSFLYIWARFFDEMKLYVDSFSTLRTVDYDMIDTIPNNFLNDLVKQYGFHLPPLFNDSSIEQYVHAENVDSDISTNTYSLKYVQNELLRRVLINMPGVLKSKGTQHSIKSFLRAIGIDPENSVRIREYGGPTSRQLTFARETRIEPSTMVQFYTSSFAVSPALSASRTEPGYPLPSGTFVNGISNGETDGLFTSGSWTIEGLYKYTPSNVASMTSITQSLMQLHYYNDNVNQGSDLVLLANVVAVSASNDQRIIAYARPAAQSSGVGATVPILEMSMSLPENGIFDGNRWNISFGRQRNDEIGSRVSSSYFLRCAMQRNGEIEDIYTTSSFFYDIDGVSSPIKLFEETVSPNSIRLAIGSASYYPGYSTYGLGLNQTGSNVPTIAKTTNFDGRVSGLRFWTKALSTIEWKEHVRNYKSLGVQDPLVNYNFVTTRTGSFEKIRLDVFNKQSNRRANATASLGVLGSFTFLDYSLNDMHMSGSGFATEEDCLKGEIFDYSYLSPAIDEATSNEKIRIRSFLDQNLVDETPWAQIAPINEIVKSEEPTDDTRLSIEFSLIDSLNKDIITLFSTFDAIDSAIGNPELLYSPDYPDLDRMRSVYFNRLSDKINYQGFFEFFKWFDTSIGTFIEQLVPRKSKFKGTNFVIESHVLERHKLEYLSNEMYLVHDQRNRILDNLLLQQIVGTVRKY